MTALTLAWLTYCGCTYRRCAKFVTSGGGTVSRIVKLVALSPEAEAGGGGGDYYDKFSTGFVGAFGGAEVFFGGLAGLVGDCRRDVLAAMTDEHLAVAAGYGASDAVFKTSNYKVETTPRKEWLFVYAPEALAEALPAGVSQASGRALGARAKEPWRHFLAHAPALISAKFAAAGHGFAVTDTEFRRLRVRREEVIGLRRACTARRLPS